MEIKLIGPEHRDVFGSRARTVEVDRLRYRVAVNRGRQVRIAFKPRGENIGFRWNAVVSVEGQGVIWTGEVAKNAGYKGIVERAIYESFLNAAWGYGTTGRVLTVKGAQVLWAIERETRDRSRDRKEIA